MSNIIICGYTTEGTTDIRFLQNIIRKTFEEIAFECDGVIEVYDPIFIGFPKPGGFIDASTKIAAKAFEDGMHTICIHVDADHHDESKVIENKITPAVEHISTLTNVCKNIISVIPVHMTEGWMLADKELFKDEIGTSLSDEALNINRDPEAISDPKALIKEALRIAQESLPRRRRKIVISDLYQPLGQKLSITALEELESFRNFKESVRGAFRKLGYLQ